MMLKEKTMEKSSKIRLSDIVKVFWRWQLAAEMSNSYERM